MSLRKDIDTLDKDIARLRIEYEQYFMRVLKREPIKLRADIERRILRLSNNSTSNTAHKFKLNSIVAKYNSYKQYWGRILRAIEEGTYTRRAEGGGAPIASIKPPPEPTGAKKPEKQTRQAKEELPKTGADDSMEKAYSKYVESRKEQNESVKGLSLDKFTRNIEASKKKIEEKYKTKNVEVKVTVKDGKTKLTLKPKK
ncbi:MAG: hypothetical protein IME99_01955 [Proteobacteria bacterium]|nr:hypothetical protein [Pseudomonadota bacterium]